MFVVGGLTTLREEVGCCGAFADDQEQGPEGGDAGGDDDDVHFDARRMLVRSSSEVFDQWLIGLGGLVVDRLRGGLRGVMVEC